MTGQVFCGYCEEWIISHSGKLTTTKNALMFSNYTFTGRFFQANISPKPANLEPDNQYNFYKKHKNQNNSP